MIGTLTIVGVGLIGGSIGLAAKKRGLARNIVGVGRSSRSLSEALELGIANVVTTSLTEGVVDADMVVFCTPVESIVPQVMEAASSCSPGTVLTDAGSTKSAIVRGLDDKLPAEVHFIGSHPLAGSEKRGPTFADANLFEKKVVVVTPTEQSDANALQKIHEFWSALGSRVVEMSPEDHDRALAVTSHLPHLLASALAGIVPEEYKPLCATGFRDTTRIAAGDPIIWSGIFKQNRDAVLQALRSLTGRLAELERALHDEDWQTIDRLLREAKAARDSLEG